jgi:hypothetical protein
MLRMAAAVASRKIRKSERFLPRRALGIRARAAAAHTIRVVHCRISIMGGSSGWLVWWFS